MNIRESIRKKLHEAVGVIPGVDLTANKIYRALTNSLENDDWSLGDWEQQGDKTYEYSGDFSVGKFNLDGVNLNLVLINTPEIDTIALQEMGLASQSSFDFDTKEYEQNLHDNELYIQIKLLVNFENDVISDLDDEFNQYLVNWIEKNKTKILSSISHEVAHSYAILIKHPTTALDRAFYEGAVEVRLGSVEPVGDLLFALYFSNEVENLVRPNELNTMFKENKITPKQFYEALTSSRVYKKYKQMRDFNYDDFVHDLETNHMDEINDVFIEAKAPMRIMKLPPKQKVLELLELISMNLRLRTKESLLNTVISPKEKFLANVFGDSGLQDDTKEYILSNLSKVLKRYPEDGEMFTKKIIKDLNIIGDKMTKKISKLYSLVNETEPQLTKVEKYKRHKN